MTIEATAPPPPPRRKTHDRQRDRCDEVEDQQPARVVPRDPHRLVHHSVCVVVVVSRQEPGDKVHQEANVHHKVESVPVLLIGGGGGNGYFGAGCCE